MLAHITSGYTGAGDLVIPGASCKVITIQNNGTGTWWLAFGADSPTGTNGGYKLPTGQQFTQTLAQFPVIGPRAVRAFFAGGGTQVLDIATDDKDSSIPSPLPT
jgi:hypothetical protein